MVNPRKAYPVDPGLIPVFDRSGGAGLGHALETCVFLELERRGAEISYVRTHEGFEVDFPARYPDGRRELLQVCADPDSPSTLEREVRALTEAKKEHPRAGLNLIVLRPETVGGIPRRVRLHWAPAWFLRQDPA